MKTMHWMGVIATSLISASTLAGCSGDDPPPAGTGGSPSNTAGTGTSGTGTSGTGTAGSTTGGTGTGGTGSAMGVQLQSPAYHTVLSGADAMAGPVAPMGYTSAACAGCHGSNAEGNPIGPEIRFTPPAYFKAVVRGGRNTPANAPSLMAAFGPASISDADLDAVVAWTNSLPKPTTGPGLYKAMCGNCHGPETPTGGSAPITIQGASIANVDKFVRMGNGTDYNDRKAYMPAYDTTLLTDQELTLIKTYIGAK